MANESVTGQLALMIERHYMHFIKLAPALRQSENKRSAWEMIVQIFFN